MSILKKLLSSNLTKYEEEQKRRYKKYVKIKKSNAKEFPKTEAELYEDYIERQKSLRQSKRKAPTLPLINEEIVFKEPNSGLNLGPAPALLEATNNYVVIHDSTPSPEEESKNNSIDNCFDEINQPPIPVRRKSRKSSDNSLSSIESNLREEEIIPTQKVIEKHQSIEMSRISMSTCDSDMFYDCISEDAYDFIDTKQEYKENEGEFKGVDENSRQSVNLMNLNEEINNAWRKNLNQYESTNKDNKIENIKIQDQIWNPQTITIKESNFQSPILGDVKTYENLKEFDESQDYYYDDDVFISSDGEANEITETFNDFVVIGSEESPPPIEIQPKLQVTKEKINFQNNDLINFFDTSENEGTILDNDPKKNFITRTSFTSTSSASSTSTSSSEGDVFEKKLDRKVNFDFANSFCTTYERPRQNSSFSEDSLEDENENQDSNPPYFNDDFYNQKDHVYKNFGIENKTVLSPIYENVNEKNLSMDLVLLNCKNGYHQEIDEENEEELDQFSEEESFDFDVNRDKRFQEYYDNIGDFKGKNVEIQENLFSIPKIEGELNEIKQTEDDVNTQIDKIHVILNQISEQIDYLESQEDEQYTPLLKLLLTCMKILGNLNCNFDEETLKSQKTNMEYISKCITTLKEKQQFKNDYI